MNKVKSMENIESVKVGTRLVWDASPAQFPSSIHDGVEYGCGLIIYPVLVVNVKPKNPIWGWLIRTSNSYGGEQWVRKSSPYLRYPTDEEIKTMKWPL